MRNFEKLKGIIGFDEENHQHKELVRYAVKHFSLDVRPKTWETDECLITQVESSFSIKHDHLTIEQIMMINRHHTPTECAEQIGANGILYVEEDCLYKYDSPSKKIYKYDGEEKVWKALTSKFDIERAKLIICGLDTCSGGIIEDQNNDNVYMMHVNRNFTFGQICYGVISQETEGHSVKEYYFDNWSPLQRISGDQKKVTSINIQDYRMKFSRVDALWDRRNQQVYLYPSPHYGAPSSLKTAPALAEKIAIRPEIEKTLESQFYRKRT